MRVAIIGGGVAGSSVASYLGSLGVETVVFEKNDSLVSGPPMCHLHAGGNLYREIDDDQCKRLLKESIEFLRCYPYGIDYRPTLVTVPKDDDGDPKEVLARLAFLQKEYASLIAQDPENEVLGRVEDYYKLYTREELEKFKSQGGIEEPATLDEWVRNAANVMDLERLKYPVVAVREYGLNVFRIAASATLVLKRLSNVTIRYNTLVKNVAWRKGCFEIFYHDKSECFDYLVNAAGFLSGKIDDMVGVHRKRLVEFKAAYVTRWEHNSLALPEIIFHGKRGTPRGMAQFTPYAGNLFQLHGMTREITLFQKGLVRASDESAQPQLHRAFLDKIEKGWQEQVLQERTRRAIKHVARFIPSFANALVGAKPLYGAQQIPGEDADLRAAEVSFALGGRYALCETVKASSVFAMAESIAGKMRSLGADIRLSKEPLCKVVQGMNKERVEQTALALARQRGYPRDLAKVLVSA